MFQVLVFNFNEFKNRLYKSLRYLGLEDTEILIKDVSYFDFEKIRYKWVDGFQ